MTEHGLPWLETERLLLTIPSPADAEALLRYAIRNREHLRPWSPPEPPEALTLAGTLQRVATMHRSFEAGTAVRLWLRYRTAPSGEFLGAVSLAGIMLNAFRACLLGYHLDHAATGQGLMTEALQRVIRYAFDELKLHRLMANYVPTNERSAALLRRLGFAVEGYARDYLFIDGKFRDHVLTSLTNA